MKIENGIIEDLGAVMGAEAAMRLIAIYGGASLYVPQDGARTHPVARLVGESAFKHLVEAFGGETIDLPEAEEFRRLRRIRQVARLLSAGHRVGDIASLLGISARQVANYRAQAEDLALLPMVFGGKAETGQMQLGVEDGG